MNFHQQYLEAVTRRHFLRNCQVGLGGIALGSLLAHDRAEATASPQPQPKLASDGSPRTHLAPKAKRVIYIHLAGSPSQLDMFDYKPKLVEMSGQDCPSSLTEGQRFAFIKGTPKLLGTMHQFKRHGEAGGWYSNLVPHLASIADDLTVVRSMHTEQFNHAPAQLALLTGNARFGYPSFGAWATYGLGTENQNLPGFVVLLSGGKAPSSGKNAWGSGFLPSVYQGVQCRSVGDPILFVSNPKGMSRQVRRQSLDALADLNQMQQEQFGDPETLTRIKQYELAYRMQVTVPEVMDLSKESAHTLQAYGAKPGVASIANNCLLARRLVEQGVRFVQLFDYGWDMHGTGAGNSIDQGLPRKCSEMDRPVAALINDLKQRGLLDDTLVIWGGEFGRTSMNEARNGSKFLGRDHHPHAFTMLFAGGGMKPGTVHGTTDDFGYFIQDGKVPVHDLQATLLHLLGFDPHRLSYPFQGLNARLIGPANDPEVRHEILA